MTTELKPLPCPFCGDMDVAMHPNDLAECGRELARPHTDVCYAHCDGCGAEGPQAFDNAEAITAWNRRAESEPSKVEPCDLLAAMIEARHALQFANDTPNGPISDTIWMMHRPETLFDFMDAAIEKAQSAGGTAPPSAQTVAQDAGGLTADEVIAFGASLLGHASETDGLDDNEARAWVRGRWIEWRGDRTPALAAPAQHRPSAADAGDLTACANCLWPKCEHNGKLCPPPYTTHWHAWDYADQPQPTYPEYDTPNAKGAAAQGKESE